MNATWLTTAGMAAWLFDIAWKGTLVLGLAGAAAWGLRRWPAAVRHGVWVAGMGCLLVLAVLSASEAGWRVLPGWGNGVVNSPKELLLAVSEAGAAAKDQAMETLSGGVVMKELGVGEPVMVAAGETAVRRQVPWELWLVMAWGVGVILFLSPVLLGPLVFWWMGRKQRKLDGAAWHRLMEECCAKMSVRGRVDLVESGEATMPMAVGFWRPRVVLPRGAEEWGEERRRIVVMHELAHIQRRDVVAQGVATAARAVYWFHPLVWMGCARMAMERERACDDAVLNAGMGAAAYAETLVEIASSAYRRMTMRYAGLAMARKSTLESRVRAVLDQDCRRGVVGRGMFMAMTGLVVGATALLGVLRAADAPKEGITLSVAPALTVGDEKTGVLSRELPDGGRVDLVAIGASSGQGPWWHADGTPTLLPEDVRFGGGANGGRGGGFGGGGNGGGGGGPGSTRYVVVHFKLPAESGLPHFQLRVSDGGQVQQLDNVVFSRALGGEANEWWQVRVPNYRNAQTSLVVGMTSGKGVKVAEGSKRTEGKIAEGRFLVSDLSKEGQFTIAHTFKDGELHAMITTEDGKEHEATAINPAQSDGLSQVVMAVQNDDEKWSPAKSYRVELRTIHWVTFENLSLAPNLGSETAATTKPALHTDKGGQIQLTPDLEYYIKNDPSLKNLENMKIGLEADLKANVARFAESDKQNETLRLRIQEVQKQIDKMSEDLTRAAGVRMQENLRKQFSTNVP